MLGGRDRLEASPPVDGFSRTSTARLSANFRVFPAKPDLPIGVHPTKSFYGLVNRPTSLRIIYDHFGSFFVYDSKFPQDLSAWHCNFLTLQPLQGGIGGFGCHGLLVFLSASVAAFLFNINIEPQLTLCDSALGR
jgi:hypothetical protein